MADEAKPKPSAVPWTEPNGIHATYDLHCHCGAVRLKMKYSPPIYAEDVGADGKRATAVECTCSHCERTGMINVHPLAENVTFTQGKEELAEYYCAGKVAPHWHCQKCGCVVGTDLSKLMEGYGMPARYSVNLRMLKDHDRERYLVRKLETMKGAPPHYEVKY